MSEQPCPDCGQPMCYHPIMKSFFGCWNPNCKSNEIPDKARVRKRRSYSGWQRIFEQLNAIKAGNLSIQDFMFNLFQSLDEQRAFGTSTKAGYSMESMLLLLKDEGIL